MTGLWICFREDEVSLRESVEVFRENHPDAKVCLCDEGAAPLTRQALNSIDPDHYERSDVFRNGNLNGCETAGMILDFHIRMGLKYGGKGAVKVDCDTVLYNSDWIDQDAPMCGISISPVYYAWGMCRWLSHEGAEAGLRTLLSRKITMGRAPEDELISSLVMSQFGARCKLYDWDPALIGGWHYNKKQQRDGIYDCSIAYFGNRLEMGAVTDGKTRRDITAETMKAYREERRRRHA